MSDKAPVGIIFTLEGGETDSTYYYLPEVPRRGDAVQLPRSMRGYVTEVIWHPVIGGFDSPAVEIVLETR